MYFDLHVFMADIVSLESVVVALNASESSKLARASHVHAALETRKDRGTLNVKLATRALFCILRRFLVFLKQAKLLTQCKWYL